MIKKGFGPEKHSMEANGNWWRRGVFAALSAVDFALLGVMDELQLGGRFVFASTLLSWVA